MNRFKVGDIIQDTGDIAFYPYGIIKKIEGEKIWCYWAKTINEILTKQCEIEANFMYTDNIGLIILDIKPKVYGIVDFMKNK